jgi:hypothetical protein
MQNLPTLPLNRFHYDRDGNELIAEASDLRDSFGPRGITFGFQIQGQRETVRYRIAKTIVSGAGTEDAEDAGWIFHPEHGDLGRHPSVTLFND